ncbi:MAG: Lrp/AsnC family transcriptional regulator [Gammaproteobacteria bacterium]|nr:Lrp/AsnC family transcriptional regulator [Gammaproteobacteria bacterium]
MDAVDRRILAELQRNGRLSNVELATRVHLSESATLRRVRALEDGGVIQGYVALLNPQRTGFGTNVFVTITLQRQEQHDLQRFEAAVRDVPEVMECYLMTGVADYLLRVSCRDAEDFERLHSQHLTRLPGVARVQSSFALRVVRRTTELPIL